MRISTDKHLVDLAIGLLAKSGVKDVIFSPGSRNAPMVLAFNSFEQFKIRVIVDERTAGFTALGMATASRTPTVLCCTSGSALLNYYPAIVEAFYKRIPLFVLSADRPSTRIDQQEGQSIRQIGVFSNHIVHQLHLPEKTDNEKHERAIWRQMNESFNLLQNHSGPIHWNFSLDEPLYQTSPSMDFPKPIEVWKPKPKINLDLSVFSTFRNADKVLILVGYIEETERAKEIQHWLNIATQRLPQLAVFYETLSNVHIDGGESGIDRLVLSLNEQENFELLPNCVISFGGETVSRKVKVWLKQAKNLQHMHIDPVLPHPDILDCLTLSVQVLPEDFLPEWIKMVEPIESNYQNTIKKASKKRVMAAQMFLKSAAFSDLTVWWKIWEALPEKTLLFNGNSSVVRYFQLYAERKDMFHIGNRGVSGIDGTTSSAIGYALNVKNLCVLATGDLAFFYDSNAFWQSPLPKNLKIILVNNGGGGIFRIIDGPSQTQYLEKHFETHHHKTAELLAAHYGLPYFSANSQATLSHSINNWLTVKGLAILEVFTPRNSNDIWLKNYFKSLKDESIQLDTP